MSRWRGDGLAGGARRLAFSCAGGFGQAERTAVHGTAPAPDGAAREMTVREKGGGARRGTLGGHGPPGGLSDGLGGRPGGWAA